jgi:ABC-2 type transport system ATP-binding protein
MAASTSRASDVTAIDITNLRRVYRGRRNDPDVVALDGVSMVVEEGEVRGLLGPNGAGKTTLVKILSTVLLPTSGTASILGRDVTTAADKVRPLIGIVFGGDRGLYWNLTGRQNLEYWAALYHVPTHVAGPRITTLIERVGMSARADSLVETYSRGMKQRLHLARGLVGNARVLFLDEPTLGMDPLAALDFRSLVKDLRSEGRTILLTTHDMAEAEALCDRVALIDHGRVLAVETPKTLSRLIAKYERIDFEWTDGDLSRDLQALPGVSSVTRIDGGPAFRIELHDDRSAQRVLAFLIDSGVTSLRTSRPTLEEVYVHMIGGRRT